MNVKVTASAKTRDPYPVYKYFEDPKEWIGNGTVVVSCKDGQVDVKIMEKDSIKIHHVSGCCYHICVCWSNACW